MFGAGRGKATRRIEPRFDEGSETADADLRADPADRPQPRRKGDKPKKKRPPPSALAAGRAGLLELRARRLGHDRRLPGCSPITPASCRRSTSSRCPSAPPNIAILAVDGSLLANRGDTGGRAVRSSDLPPYLPKAFVAIEDRRFYHHFGIDPARHRRAVFRDVSGRQAACRAARR